MSSVYDLDEAANDPVLGDEPRRRGPAVAAALALLGALVAGLVMLSRGASSPSAVEAIAGRAMPPTAVAEIVETAEPAPTIAPSKSATADADTVEACGLGRVRKTEFDASGHEDDPFEVPTREAARRTIERLLAQPDERSRAAGQFLRAASMQIASLRDQQAQHERDGIDCTKQTCTWAPTPAEAGAARDALVRAAVGTQDPWVYALAYQSCQSMPLQGEPVAACQMVSIERWTQLEPDNAIPWLHAASEAQQRKDAAGVAEALYRASQARRSDTRFGQLAVVARAQEPANLAPVIGLGMDAMAVGIDAAFAIPAYQGVLQHCSKEALVDPNRRAVCEGLAQMLAERSGTLLDLSIGLALGKRLDWPSARVQALEELRDAIHGLAINDPLNHPDGSMRVDCDAVREQRARLAATAELGELGAYRQRIAQSSLSRTELAARKHEWAAQVQRKAAAEAAAQVPTAEAAASAPMPPAPDGMLRTASTAPRS